jgi:hypothetical protein
MSMVRVFEKGFMYVAVIAFMAICSSCQTDQSKHTGSGNNPDPKVTRSAHQLGQVCPADHTSQAIRISVDPTNQVLTDLNDAVILACEKDTIVWFTTTPNTKITITIKSTNPKELFVSGDTTVIWDPNNPGNGKANETLPETVARPVKYLSFHKYSIDMDDVDPQHPTHPHHNIDPHVIPMGNGGP